MKPAHDSEHRYSAPVLFHSFQHILNSAVEAPSDDNKAVSLALFWEQHGKALVGAVVGELLFSVQREVAPVRVEVLFIKGLAGSKVESLRHL